MRHEFRKEMSLLEDTLKLQAREAANAMKRAAASLKDANLALAESVIDADHHIDFLERNVDEMGISLLARQAPVASDLRTVMAVHGRRPRIGESPVDHPGALVVRRRRTRSVREFVFRAAERLTPPASRS